MYYGHYHAIISHPRGNSSLSRKLMIVCELISLFFPLSISLSRQATFTGTSTRISSMEIALCLQSVTVVDCQANFTSTSTTISYIVMALWLQSVTIVHQRAMLTGTSTRISSMVMVLWLQSVAVVDQQATFTAFHMMALSLSPRPEDLPSRPRASPPSSPESEAPRSKQKRSRRSPPSFC